jgi:hypothetical protein
MRKEAKDIQAVVDAERDDAALRHARAVVARLRAVAGDVAAAVEIDQHRQPLRCWLGRRPHVEVQAILAHAIRAEVHVAEDGQLHGARPELIGLAHARPRRGRLRRAPAQATHRRGGERDALEAAHARSGLDRPFQDSAGHSDAGVVAARSSITSNSMFFKHTPCDGHRRTLR